MATAKPIPGFDRYSVTEDGRVFGPRGELKPHFRGSYLAVRVAGVTTSVHRLVATAWLEPKAGAPNVNHLDGDKANNHRSNLEWCTQSENIQHALRTGLFRGLAPVIGVNAETGEGVWAKSLRSLIALGFSNSHVSECLSGKRKTHRGFTWEFA